MEKNELSKKYRFKYRARNLKCIECSKISGCSNLNELFIELGFDEETNLFLENCQKFRFQLMKASFLRPIFNIFYTKIESNGILGTGKMFLFSTNHLRTLLCDKKFNNILDIGSGDGNVTKKFKDFLTEDGKIFCIETVAKLQKSLLKQGFFLRSRILEEDNEEIRFDLVLLLNVLDRCSNPITILKEIRKIKDKPLIIISVVLPFSGFYVENGIQHSQLEEVIGYFKDWDESVHRLAKIFLDLGFQITNISRLPYLSEGNLFGSRYYFLDTVIFILE